MTQHPAVYVALARDRIAELRRAAEAGSWSRSQRLGRPSAGRARRAAGWFLVDAGLRLAVPRGVSRPA